MFRLL
jgi:small subunit ribosomal protein S18e